MRRLKIIGIIASILIGIVVIMGIIFTTLYKDEVERFIIEQINNSVNTKIDVKEVSFSVFKKFPYASLEFTKVTAEEVTENTKKGTLFSAESIFLQFNVIDILNDNYTIKKIHVNDGIVNLQIDKYGNDNYHFWKKNTDSTDNQLSVELNKLEFNQVTFYLLNEYKNLDFSIEAEDLSLSGNFSKEEFKLKTNAQLYFYRLNSNNHNFVKDKRVYVNTSFNVNQKTGLYSVDNGTVKVQDLTFNVEGTIKNSNKLVLDLSSKGKDLAIDKLVSLLPEHKQGVFNYYNSKGIITYNSTIKGEISATKSPLFTANFDINGGEIQEQKSGQVIKNINLKGTFTNGAEHSFKTAELTLEKLDFDVGPGHVSGTYQVNNLIKPYIVINSKAEIDIEAATQFFKLDTFELATGNLSLNLNYSGYLSELDSVQAKDLKRLNAKGNAQLSDANFKILNTPQVYKNVNGDFSFNNNDIVINKLTAKINSSDMAFQGSFTNLLSYLFIDNEKLTVKANLKSNKVIMDEFLLSNQENDDSLYMVSLPNNLEFNLNTSIDTFYFRKFKGYLVKGKFKYNNKTLHANNLEFVTMKGSVNGNIEINESANQEILTAANLTLNNVDIKQLFKQCENFGQKYIVANNLEGKTSLAVDFAAVWDNHLRVKKEKIYANADIVITNGELIDYKPVLAMSKFIEVEELEHISFKTLKTNVEIKNQTISIPNTDIRSSAIDLQLAGTHTFNNVIDYKFRLLLNDILWKKAKKKKKENSEFGYIEDDGLGKTTLFLHMTGTVNDYKIKYDTRSLRKEWKKDFKNEKQNLKEVLNKEFGWFKKDSTITNKNNKKEDSGFQIEWEEDEKPEEEKTGKKLNKNNKTEKTNKKGLKKLLDKIADPNEEEYDENGDF